MNEKLIREKCEVLTKMIISLAEIYHHQETTPVQKKLIETTIGAAIWYLPHPEEFWTGYISESAIELCKEIREKKGLSKEHEIPRKRAAIELLTTELQAIKEDKNKLFELFVKKYSQYNYVTSLENKRLVKAQKEVNYNSKEAYKKINILLIKKSKAELDNLIRKKNPKQ